MTERPMLCRNSLRDAGKPYPRSGCAICKDGGLMGCPYDRPVGANLDDVEALLRQPAMTEEITQADREAAAAISTEALRPAILRGEWDDTAILKALALHRTQARQAALEEAAKVADGRGIFWASVRSIDNFGMTTDLSLYLASGANDAATAIRTLSTPEPTKGE